MLTSRCLFLVSLPLETNTSALGIRCTFAGDTFAVKPSRSLVCCYNAPPCWPVDNQQRYGHTDQSAAIPLTFFRPAGRRTFSQSAARNSYADTIQNLLIHKDTRVLCQGLTGKTVREHWGFMSQSSTKITIIPGNFPRKGSPGIRYQHGWRSIAKEGWSNTSGSPNLWQC